MGSPRLAATLAGTAGATSFTGFAGGVGGVTTVDGGLRRPFPYVGIVPALVLGVVSEVRELRLFV